MSRIAREAVVRAVVKVQGMGFAEKQRLADELFHAQSHVLASVLVQGRLGVSAQKMDFLLGLVLVAFQAMRESGLTWPLITDDDQDRRMAHLADAIRFREELPEERRTDAIRTYIALNPEKELLAHVYTETTRWLQHVVPEEADKHVMLAALNFVDCIAYVPLPEATAAVQRGSSSDADGASPVRPVRKPRTTQHGRNRNFSRRGTSNAQG